jgi:hypothetical protein
MFWERISLGDHERALVARNHQLKTVLTPGRHVLLAPPFVSLEVETHNTNELVLQSKWAGHLLDRMPRLAEEHFVCVGTNEVQVAMIYANGQLFKVLTPFSRILIWRNVAEIRVELVEVIGDLASDDSDSELEFPLDLVKTFR